jgi:hypothetical protein
MRNCIAAAIRPFGRLFGADAGFAPLHFSFPRHYAVHYGSISGFPIIPMIFGFARSMTIGSLKPLIHGRSRPMPDTCFPLSDIPESGRYSMYPFAVIS